MIKKRKRKRKRKRKKKKSQGELLWLAHVAKIQANTVIKRCSWSNRVFPDRVANKGGDCWQE